MARYPTFEEYRKRGNFPDGIKRCDDLLKRNPNDVQLLIVKLQLLYATAGDVQTILQQLASLQPPIVDLGEIVAIEDAVENSQRDVYPRPNTTGPTVATIWDTAFKASNSINHKLDLQSLRFSRAVVDNRLLDAQQALIQLKALQPKNRVIYMAHAAITQLLSSAKEDLQSRLALSLARKAVKENFDADKSLDCRVTGQIFALQAEESDLDGIVGRSFAEVKQVYDARQRKEGKMNGDGNIPPTLDSATVLPSDWLASEVQLLKHQFARLIAASAPLPSIVSFAGNAVRLFHTAKTSIPDLRGRGLADACFLSISSLVRLFELSNDSRHLLHAAFLAETLLKQNPQVHEARLILVYLYMNLGLGSLAMRLFHSLNVKEIQHDTVGHVLFTRLSITHPHRTDVDKRDVLDPQKTLSHALTVYTRHEEKLADTEASVLNHEQTGMIFALRELRHSLRTSMTRRIIYLEQRRIARLLHDTVGDEPTQMGPRLTANWLNVTDNRDFAATFDFGYNVERVLHDGGLSALSTAPAILYGLAADCAWCMAQGAETAVKDVETLVEETSRIGVDFGRLKLGDAPLAAEGVTRAELLAGELACLVLRMLLRVPSESEDLKVAIAAVLTAVQSLDLDAFMNRPPISTEGLQPSYVYLDILRIVSKACAYAGEKRTDHRTEFQDIQTLMEGKCAALLRYSREQAKGVNAAAIKAHMERDVGVCDTVKLVGDGSLVDFCSEVAAAANEGWEGLSRVTVG